MRSISIAIAFTSLLGTAAVSAATAPLAARVILVGDSTLAANSGYGDALCARFDASVECINLAKGGRSSKSYRAEGSWTKVVDLLSVKSSAEKTLPTFVLIQFGHNDQPGKAERSTTLPEFTANLIRYAEEVQGARAVPVLITPLTRRQFKEGKLIRGLEEWANATRTAAAKTQSPLLDLHRDSVAAVEKLGSPQANEFAQAPPPPEVITASATGTTIEAPKPEHPTPGQPVFDYTHLGNKGAEFFSGLVAAELADQAPALGKLLK